MLRYLYTLAESRVTAVSVMNMFLHYTQLGGKFGKSRDVVFMKKKS